LFFSIPLKAGRMGYTGSIFQSRHEPERRWFV